MDFTGYNINGITELARAIKTSYNSLGEIMANPWPTLQATMQAEWVGPDEQSYEGLLAKDICTLYEVCRDTIQTLMNNVVAIGEAWKEFQSKNIISGAETYQAVGSLPTAITLDGFDIAGVVNRKEVDFTYYTNYGLVNGQNSYNVINTALEQYVTEVINGVNSLYQSLDSSKAFLGGGQADTINEYMVRIGQAVSNVSTAHDAIKEALRTLLANYNAQVSEINTQVNAAGTEGQQQ